MSAKSVFLAAIFIKITFKDKRIIFVENVKISKEDYTYSGNEVAFCVEYLVPERVKFINIVVVLERELVGS